MPDSNAVISRTELINAAFRRIGIDTPSTNESALAVVTLNLITREVDTEGRWLWAVSNTAASLTLADGTASYSGGSGSSNIPLYTLSVERVEIVVGSAPYVPLLMLSKDDWFNSAYRGTSGQPLVAYFERAVDSSNSKLWFGPTPDSAYTANVFTRRRLYDFDNASDNPDVPQEGALFLIKRLAQELAPENGVPLEERVLIKNEADEALAKFRAANSEPPTRRPTRIRGQYF